MMVLSPSRAQTQKLPSRLAKTVFCIMFLALAVFSVGLTTASAATHYISASGSDSNTGTSKTSPWAHLPGMPNCAANCASYNPQPGDQFILKGGDTWGASSLGINWQWSGTSTSRIYIGVDQTWFSGSSWTRPIFNCQNTACSSNQYGNIIWLAGNYTTIDNFEFTGYQQSGGANLIGVYGNNNEVEHFYIHGWSRTSGSSGSNSFAITNNGSGGGGQGSMFHDNVIDGGDSPNKDFMGGILHGDKVYNNIIRYVYNGMNGAFNDVHGNLVEYNYQSPSGDHCNMIFVQGTYSGSTLYAYNNVIRHSGCSGVTLWLMGNSTCSSCTTYAYNNVIYDTGASFDQGITIGGHPDMGQAVGTYNVYNNTIDASGGALCMGNGGTGSFSSTTNYGNNHCINAGAICGGATNCVNKGTNLAQTESVANGQGYTATEKYAYSPASSSGSTVGAGTNLSGLCSGNLSALCTDTTYPTYNTTNHTVVMRATGSRGSVWDIGAYQYNTNDPAPAPPTGLAVVVN